MDRQGVFCMVCELAVWFIVRGRLDALFFNGGKWILRIAHVSPWLHFSELSDPARFYASCRFALLAYCAFPNAHPAMSSGHQIQSLSDEDARAVAAEFLTATAGVRAKWRWNTPPQFLVTSWLSAQRADARKVAAAQKKATNMAAAPSTGAVRYVFDTDDETSPPADELPDTGLPDVPGGSTARQHLRRLTSALSSRHAKELDKLWAAAEQEETAELETLGDEARDTLRRATDAWLRRRSWGHRELHDGLVSLGAALPARLSRRVYLQRLRTVCGDPKAISLPGGTYPVKVLKPALQSLRLGVAGSKAQLIDRLARAIKEEPASDEAEGGPEAGDGEEELKLDVEDDIGKSATAVAFAAKAAAAWQEYSGGGLHVLDDDLEYLSDSEEADVRAEQEALLQLRRGVNPPDGRLAAPRRHTDSHRPSMAAGPELR